MQLTDSNSDSNTLDENGDTIDNISDTNEINTELTDTNDTLSDTNEIDTELTAYTSNTLSDIDDIIQTDPTEPQHDPGSPTSVEDVYHFIEQRLLSLDPFTTMGLGSLDYHVHYHPHYIRPEKEGGFGKTLYKKSPVGTEIDTDELGLVFFGEVCSSAYGTAISAKGNHYAGTAENPKVRTSKHYHSGLMKTLLTFFKPIIDTSVVKDILVLRPLTIAPANSLVDIAFVNQCAGLEEILEEDAKRRSLHPDLEAVSINIGSLLLYTQLTTEQIDVTEFLVSANPESNERDRSFIKLTLPPKYKVSESLHTHVHV